MTKISPQHMFYDVTAGEWRLDPASLPETRWGSASRHEHEARCRALPAGEVEPEPRVGDTVIFYNRHGFPRAAMVTGTQSSLVGEQHVTLIDDPSVVHLVVFSPLPRTYPEQSVPRWIEGTERSNVWAPR